MTAPVLDLFSGAGGLSHGLHGAGLDPVAAVEISSSACDTYSRLHPDAEMVEEDIARVDFHRFRGQVSVVAGGPPCQPFSTGGLRLGAADERNGFPEFLRAVGEIRPDAALIENVAGLARGASKGYLKALIRELEDLNFVVQAKVLAATDYGVPQRRERLFIIATREPGFRFPEPTHGPGRAAPWVPSGSVLRIDEMFGEPNPSIVTYAKRPDLRPSPYDGLLFNGGGRPIDLAAPARTILASAGGNKTPFIDSLGVVPEYHAYLMAGGRSRRGRVPGARRITVAEAAALQTFPRSLRFSGSRSVQYTLVGNAVPAKLAEAVGSALLEYLATRVPSALAA